MCRKVLLSLLALLASSAGAAADPVRLLLYAGAGTVAQEARTAFAARFGPDLMTIDLAGLDIAPDRIDSADIILLIHLEERFALSLEPALLRAQRRGAMVAVTPPELVPRQWTLKPDVTTSAEAQRYWSYGGVDNAVGMLAYLYKVAGGARPLDVPEPRPTQEVGIYHPRASGEFASLGAYLMWYRAQGLVPPTAPLVGITFYTASLRQRDLAHIDALVAGLEKAGIGAVPLFGWPFNTLESWLTEDGRCPLEVLLTFNLSIMRPADSALLERLGVHALNLEVTPYSADEWRSGLRGLPPESIGYQVATPERAGTAEPIVVATTELPPGAPTRISQPIDERVSAAVGRAARWITLRRKPNPQKRVVFVYYNNPPGKGNLGASYLQVLPSMATLLARLKDDGYSVGAHAPDQAELTDTLERAGRNVADWAPGELQAMVDTGRVALFPISEYERHFAGLPRAFQEMVTKEYGPPRRAEMLRVRRDGIDFFVIPGAQYGNVLLSVQPLRSTFERAVSTTHDTTIPVPHSYVAAYLYYRFVFKADAVVHIGRHGTLEWLPGKQVMQAGWDHAEALLGDLPNPYLYIMDGDAESLQAMRRSAGVMMSHLTPLIVSGGVQDEIRALSGALRDWDAAKETDAALAVEYAKQAAAEARRLHLDRQLGLSVDADGWPAAGTRLLAWVREVEDGPIPAGIHALGELPAEDVQRDALTEFIKYGFQPAELLAVEAEVRPWADAIFDGREPVEAKAYPAPLLTTIRAQWDAARQWIGHLRVSPRQEVDALPRVLSGGYLPPSPLGEPLRTPAGLPTGRKQFGFDPTLIPTRAAWEVGRKMADDTLARYRRDHGEYPAKVAMVLWYGETESHHGAMESMAMHLMGVELQWNARNQPDALRLIPDAELAHPRVDVIFTVSGIYRDGLPDKILLLDRAARLAASAGDNAIARHDRETTEALLASGLPREQAERIARARLFGNKPGAYNIGVDLLVAQSRDVDNAGTMANLYLHNMNAAFSSDTWGEDAPGALATQMRGNQAVLFSRSSNLYGTLDNDDTFSYAGGLSFASAQVNGGAAPAFYISNLRKAGAERSVDLKTWLATELNQRNWNPKWIGHMQASGYAGAREMNDEIEHLYGFQATTKEQMDGSFWQNTYDVYVADKHGLELDAFFERENPHAKQGLLARLLEVDRQGSYRFSDAERTQLVSRYVRSVVAHGAACAANICGNERLQRHVAETAALVPGLGPAELRQFGEQLGRATRWVPSRFTGAPAAVREGLAAGRMIRPTSTAGRPSPPPAPPPVPTDVPPRVEGFALQERIIDLSRRAPSPPPAIAWVWLLVLGGLIAAGAGWEARRSSPLF